MLSDILDLSIKILRENQFPRRGGSAGITLEGSGPRRNKWYEFLSNDRIFNEPGTVPPPDPRKSGM
jgi:hypothetical protein